ITRPRSRYRPAPTRRRQRSTSLYGDEFILAIRGSRGGNANDPPRHESTPRLGDEPTGAPQEEPPGAAPRGPSDHRVAGPGPPPCARQASRSRASRTPRQLQRNASRPATSVTETAQDGPETPRRGPFGQKSLAPPRVRARVSGNRNGPARGIF